MATIFSRIIAGEIPSYKVAEDDFCYAFLDINPLAGGHTLVVPKLEVDYIFDLPESDYGHLFAFARKVATAQKAAIECKRIGVAVLGMEVPHAHIHLVPLQSEADLDFRKEKLQFTPEQFADYASRIAAEFKKL